MPQIRRSSLSGSVRILRLDMVLCRFVSIGSAVADMGRENRAIGVESAPADRRRSYTAILTYRDVGFAHCSSAHCSLPAAGHNNSSLTRAALWCDHTSYYLANRLGNWRAYRAATHTCPTCQRVAHALSWVCAPEPPIFNAVVGPTSRRRLVSTGHVAVLV
jgi:hypothetical protein